MRDTPDARFKYYLNTFLEESLKERNQAAAELLSANNAAEYRLRWLDGVATAVYKAQYAEQLLSALDQLEGSQERVLEILAHHERSLASWAPSHSSSAYTNIANEERLFALRETVPLVKRYLDELSAQTFTHKE